MEIGDRHDEVRVLAEAFDHMLDRVQDAFDRQTAFVADASHELRTPLTVVRGQLEVLALAEHPDSDDVRRVQKLVGVEVDRMSRLVRDENERQISTSPRSTPSASGTGAVRYLRVETGILTPTIGR